MNRTLSHIRHMIAATVVALLTAMMPTACSESGSYIVAEEPEADCRNVGFRMTLNSISATRTTPGDGPYDDGRGTEYENYINVIGGDYKVLLFEAEAPYKLAAEIYDIEITAVEADVPTSKTYILLGKVPNSMKNGSYKLMLLANWEGCEADYPKVEAGVTTIDAVTADAGNVYSYTRDSAPGPHRGIPMFGINDCKDVVFRKDVAADLGTIHLLRAMAKVEVKPVDSGSSIKKATMTRVNDKGLAAPQGIYSQDDYVKGNYKDDYLSGIHLPDYLEVTEDVPFIEQPDGSFVIYVPEYDNTSPSAPKSKIHLEFKSGYDAELEFKFYDSKAALDAGKNVGDPFDIARNNWYTFTVTENGVCQVTIMPMRAVDLDMDFGFDDLFPKNIK